MQETWTTEDFHKHMRGGTVAKKPTKRPCPSRLEITIPLPDKAASPNSRGHWAKKAKAVKKLREAAAIASKVALMSGNYDAPRWERAEVQATFYKRDPRAKAQDQDNAIASLKGAIDGLQDAQIVANDFGLTHLPPIQRVGEEACGRNEVVLDIVAKDTANA